MGVELLQRSDVAPTVVPQLAEDASSARASNGKSVKTIKRLIAAVVEISGRPGTHAHRLAQQREVRRRSELDEADGGKRTERK
jgi:hypothetical protein